MSGNMYDLICTMYASVIVVKIMIGLPISWLLLLMPIWGLALITVILLIINYFLELR